MKILITGSTGLVGSALVGELKQAGHTVCRLVRPDTNGEALRGSGGFDVRWDPATGKLGAAAVGAEAVVNLAGASIAGGRWTAERKKVLRSSRVDSTRALVNAMAKMAARPRVLVSSSAIGIYGDRGEEILNEDSGPGLDFLSEIAKEWEAEAEKGAALGIRVVRARFGVVLAKKGGALPVMARSFRFGVGGRIGSGQQWMSWISMEDVLKILRLALEDGTVRGAVNLVSPQPARNAEFTSALAKALHRPALFPAPAFALRLALGEMADALLLASQRVVPGQLEKLGYKFTNPDLPTTLNRLFT
ncbi:MAG: TIGR01777 family oxidoreductase [Candidatus Acidiferrum sp.]